MCATGNAFHFHSAVSRLVLLLLPQLSTTTTLLLTLPQLQLAPLSLWPQLARLVAQFVGLSVGRSFVRSLATIPGASVWASRPVPSRLVPSRLRPAAIVPPPLPPIGYVVPARNSAPARFARPSVSVLRSRRRRPVIVATIIIIIVTGSVATAAVVGPWK